MYTGGVEIIKTSAFHRIKHPLLPYRRSPMLLTVEMCKLHYLRAFHRFSLYLHQFSVDMKWHRVKNEVLRSQRGKKYPTYNKK